MCKCSDPSTKSLLESPFEKVQAACPLEKSLRKVPSQSPFGGRAHAPRRHRPRHCAASGVAGWRKRPPPPSALARPLRGAKSHVEPPGLQHPNNAFTYINLSLHAKITARGETRVSSVHQSLLVLNHAVLNNNRWARPLRLARWLVCQEVRGNY